MLEHMLAPTVRIHPAKGKGGVGSGVVIFSSRLTVRIAHRKTSKKRTMETLKIVHTYVLTNWHVIDENISFTYAKQRRMHLGRLSAVREKWEAKRKPLEVQVFTFGEQVSRQRKRKYMADIVACSKEMDLALLRLRSRHLIADVAPLAPQSVRLPWFMDVWAVGCPKGLTPIATKGNPSGMWTNEEKKTRLMTTTPTTDGNSGGGLYYKSLKRDRYEVMGIVTECESDAPHINYCVPIKTIYEFLEKHGFGFILKAQNTETPA